jgi:hypothetical protein
MRTWVLPLAVLVSLHAGVAAQPVDEKLLSEIESAWKDRQAKVRSAVVDIEAEAIYPPGSISNQYPDQFAGKVMPPEEKRTKTHVRVVFDGERVRVEEEGFMWSGTAFEDSRRVTVYTERERREIRVRGGKTIGYVSAEVDFFETKTVTYAPILRHLRGTGPKRMRFLYLDEWRPTGQQASIRGAVCRNMVVRHDSGGSTDYWLQPSAGWAIVRETQRKSSGERIDLDVTYQDDSRIGRMPSGWESSTVLKSGKLGIKRKFAVVEYQLDREVKQDEFKLTFPTGTTVIDETWSLKAGAIVDENGKYQLHPDTPEATRKEITQAAWQQTQILWLMWGGIGLIAMTVGFAVTRRLRRRKSV